MLKEKKYRIINTCSIDYFIIIMAVVGKFNNSILLMKDKSWKNFFIELSKYVITQNNWDLARYCFLTFKNHIVSTINNNESLTDCFLSEYDSYMNLYNEKQEYKWEKKCIDENSKSKSGYSSSFSLK